ncbi:Eco57I restriction-modification methylase domain-containing protein [Corynebacterium phocae]|uniref:Eco57I restriction-modification methylase domain-containing protein n=1 Tax=Corynebacterium phocae TaxID=161895 RepID=UPI0009511151|nr:Eco57I restriction-modification methylase domain-containing protein [Corynebacterium phocae]
MSSLLQRSEKQRVDALNSIGIENLGVSEQFFTPAPVAELMARMLVPENPQLGSIKLLDPGAGTGILTAAVTARLGKVAPGVPVHVTAVEKESAQLPQLRVTLEDCARTHGNFTFEIKKEDFIDLGISAHGIFAEPQTNRFDLCIQNPPYSKLPASDRRSQELKKLGIHVPNIYAAFMALAHKLLKPGGAMISITPRSWYNGPYFAAFRNFLTSTGQITDIHTFESRRKVFADTKILQETIITRTVADPTPVSEIAISTSHAANDPTSVRKVAFSSVFSGNVIFVPTSNRDEQVLQWLSRATSTISDLPFTVSTGKVIDFRSREQTFSQPSPRSVPLIYPANFSRETIHHPQVNLKKPQWFEPTQAGEDKKLIPPGNYVLVKRFSSKEEFRRITAAVWQADTFTALDNKVNFFHSGGHGMNLDTAKGLCIWLNSDRIDHFFRLFSGHTQVNATDLRMLPYPSVAQLQAMARSNMEAEDAIEQVFKSLGES